MNHLKNLLNNLQARIIYIGLIIVSLLLVLYLSCSKFRIFLANQNIDPNFIIGFFTIIALFLSLIQNSKDKRYSYNLKLIDSIEDKGLKIIGKLLGIRGKSSMVLSSAQHCIQAKKQCLVFRDHNNSLSKEDIESDMELIAACVDLYFPEQNTSWNNLLGKLTQISNITGAILENYNENLEWIQKKIPFTNLVLDNADTSLIKAEEINKEIEDLSLNMRNEIVAKMNNSKKKLKDSFSFKL